MVVSPVIIALIAFIAAVGVLTGIYVVERGVARLAHAVAAMRGKNRPASQPPACG